MLTTVDFPLWREQLRSTLFDVERSRSTCQGSGCRPKLLAKTAWSRASLRSSASVTITDPLQGAQDGTSRLRVCVQGPDYERAQLHPLGRDVEVHHGSLVELTGELAKKFQVPPRLRDRRQGGP